MDKKPPDPIPEEPAAEKPEGKNVQWIPGYWQWDTDKKDFIWISGMWRDIPAGRRWVMGYWANTNEGYRWVSGHFADANERDSQYVPEPPPENPDEGPTAPPPDDSSSYVPGSWFYGDDGYTYRTGYWTQCYDDRVWIPSYYNWTPYGYEFCSGYWDYPLGRRGLLFAPVYLRGRSGMRRIGSTGPITRSGSAAYTRTFSLDSAIGTTSLAITTLGRI